MDVRDLADEVVREMLEAQRRQERHHWRLWLAELQGVLALEQELARRATERAGGTGGVVTGRTPGAPGR